MTERRPADGDRALMASVGALMYLVAGAVVALSLVAPGHEMANPVALVAGSVAGFVTAAWMWLLRERLPRHLFHLTSAAGTVMTALCVYWSGEQSSPYSFLFLWVATFGAYFFTPAQVVAHLSLAGAVYALALVELPPEGDAFEHWLLTMVGVSLAAAVIRQLVSAREGLEAAREQLLAHTIELARTDPLTGLLNRRAWYERLEEELERAQRSSAPVCVAMLDLDYFKAFNDEHGHIAGDDLLRAIASVWKLAIRPADSLGRYGGEEFALVLPECEIERAVEVIERLRASVPRDQRCSVGIARWDGQETPLDLVARADARLYAAKNLGRDRIVAAPWRTETPAVRGR